MLSVLQNTFLRLTSRLQISAHRPASCKHKSLYVRNRPSWSGSLLVLINIIFLCSSPWSVQHRHTHRALAASAASFLCSWSISLGAVFRAWGQWEHAGGGAGGCICQGTSFRGPTAVWLGFHVCLQKHNPVEGERVKGRQWRCHCYFPCMPSVSVRVWGDGECQHRAAFRFLVYMYFTLEVRNAECTQYYQ